MANMTKYLGLGALCLSFSCTALAQLNVAGEPPARFARLAAIPAGGDMSEKNLPPREILLRRLN